MGPCPPQTPDYKKLKVMYNFLSFGKPKNTTHYLFWFEYKLTATGTHASSKLTYTLLYSVIRNSGSHNSVLIQWETG
jgi:hypothetical protein